MAKKKADSTDGARPKISKKEFISGLKIREVRKDTQKLEAADSVRKTEAGGVKLISSRKPKIYTKIRALRPDVLCQVTRKEGNYLEVSFNEIDHGMLSLLKERLNFKDEVLECGYFIDHPVVGKPVFKLRTKGKEALEVWNKTVEEVLKELVEFKAAVVKAK